MKMCLCRMNRKMYSYLFVKRVYCGHEYTVYLLQSARQIEPKNERLAEKLAWAQREVAAGRLTVPSTINDELATNPFMRVRFLLFPLLSTAPTHLPFSSFLHSSPHPSSLPFLSYSSFLPIFSLLS